MEKSSLSVSPKECFPEEKSQGQSVMQFLSQMMRNLNNSTSLDDFKKWVNEHVPKNTGMCQQPNLNGMGDPSNGGTGIPISFVSLEMYGGRSEEEGSSWDEGIQTVCSPFKHHSLAEDSFRMDAPLYLERGSQDVCVLPDVALDDEIGPPLGSLVSPTAKQKCACERTNTEKDVASLLQSSISWGSNHSPRGAGPFGFSKRLRDVELNRFIRFHNSSSSPNQLISVMDDNSISTFRGRSCSCPLPVRCDMSILHSRSFGNFAEGMPEFSLEGHLPGQRVVFLRNSSRHTAVLRPIDDVRKDLFIIDVPFLEDVDSPTVNVLSYWERYGINDYVYTCLNILLRYNFSQRFGFDLKKICCFYQTAVAYIRPRNPLQNTSHAANIVIAAHQFLLQPHFADNFSDEELFSFLFASTVMKLGNTGTNNRFLIAVRHPYVTAHGYFSPLQSVSISLAFALLDNPDCYFLTILSTCEGGGNHFSSTVWTRSKEIKMRDIVTQLIMATDKRNHCTWLNDMKMISGDGALREVGEDQIMIILRNILHTVDFCYLFCSLPVYKAAAFGSVAELYRRNHAFRCIAAKHNMRWPKRCDSSCAYVASDKTSAEKGDLQDFNIAETGSTPMLSENIFYVEYLQPELLEVVNEFVPSVITTTHSALTVNEETLMQSPKPCAKMIHMSVMNLVFAPYIEALSQFIPAHWLKNVEENFSWLYEYPAEAFEADVLRTQHDVDRWDPTLPLGSDNFETRVLDRIMAPLF